MKNALLLLVLLPLISFGMEEGRGEKRKEDGNQEGQAKKINKGVVKETGNFPPLKEEKKAHFNHKITSNDGTKELMIDSSTLSEKKFGNPLMMYKIRVENDKGLWTIIDSRKMVAAALANDGKIVCIMQNENEIHLSYPYEGKWTNEILTASRRENCGLKAPYINEEEEGSICAVKSCKFSDENERIVIKTLHTNSNESSVVVPLQFNIIFKCPNSNRGKDWHQRTYWN